MRVEDPYYHVEEMAPSITAEAQHDPHSTRISCTRIGPVWTRHAKLRSIDSLDYHACRLHVTPYIP